MTETTPIDDQIPPTYDELVRENHAFKKENARLQQLVAKKKVAIFSLREYAAAVTKEAARAAPPETFHAWPVVTVEQLMAARELVLQAQAERPPTTA